MSQRPQLLGSLVAIAVFALDQATKAWMTRVLDRQAVVTLLPVLDLRLARNRGISYSLLSADGPLGRILLVLAALAAVVALTVWLVRTRQMLTAVALGFLIGGALGNALDRAINGAVTDFVHVHWGQFAPFGVFNVGDTAITVGVLLLLYEALFIAGKGQQKAATAKSSTVAIDSVNNLP